MSEYLTMFFTEVFWYFLFFVVGGFALTGVGVNGILRWPSHKLLGWFIALVGLFLAFYVGPGAITAANLRGSFLPPALGGIAAFVANAVPYVLLALGAFGLYLTFLLFSGNTDVDVFGGQMGGGAGHVQPFWGVVMLAQSVFVIGLGISAWLAPDPILKSMVVIAQVSDEKKGTNFNAFYTSGSRPVCGIQNLKGMIGVTAENKILEEAERRIDALPAAHPAAGFVPGTVKNLAIYSADGKTWTHLAATVKGKLGVVDKKITIRIRQGETVHAAQEAALAVLIHIRDTSGLPPEDFAIEPARTRPNYGNGYSPTPDTISIAP